MQLMQISTATLAVLAALVLSGCDANETAVEAPIDTLIDKPTAQATSGESASPVPPPVVVQQERLRSTVAGSIGGSIRLTDDVGAVYSIALRDGGAWLEGVALLRGAKSGWYNTGTEKVPVALDNVGVGASLGRHIVLVTPSGDGVWVDDSLKVDFGPNNVALLDGAGAALKLVGTAAIEPYLGPAPLEDAKQRQSLVQGRLSALLRASVEIKALWPARVTN